MRIRLLRLPRSLRGQFALTLVLLSSLIVAGGGIAVLALRHSAVTSRQLAEERLDHLEDAESLIRHSFMIERETNRMMVVDSLDSLQESYREVLEHLAMLDSLVVHLSRAHTQIDILDLHQASQLFRNSAHIVTRLRQEMLKSGPTSANLKKLDLFREQLENQVAAMGAAADHLSGYLTSDYRERIGKLAAITRRNQEMVMLLAAASLILAWLVARYFLGRRVVQRLQKVSRYLRTGSSETGQILVPVQGQDEIGEMARAVERFLEDRRKLAETKLSLQQSEEMLRAITDAVQCAVFLVDDKDRIQFANPAVEAMFGYSADEILGRRLHETLVPYSMRSQAEEGVCAFQRTGDGPVLNKPQEMIARHRSGREINILIHVGTVDRKGRRWAVGSVVDITELRQAEDELKKAQNEAMYAARMASIGQLAAGIAHEINTPAQYINTNLHFMEEAMEAIIPVLIKAKSLATVPAQVEPAAFEEVYEEADVDFLVEEVPQAISQSLQGIEKVSQIVRSMKEFAHPGESEKVVTNINKLVENVITIAQSTGKGAGSVEIVTRLDHDLPLASCNIGEMNQVILNLLLNSLQAVKHSTKEGQGEVIVETRAAEDEVQISVADSGDGIAMEIREHIFDPFFTTKTVGEGTGQGLAICYDIIVNKHHGRIDVGGTPGEGAVFTVHLPGTKEARL